MKMPSPTLRRTSTDQVPQRLIEAGRYNGLPFGRFDSLDATDAGATEASAASRRRGVEFNNRWTRRPGCCWTPIWPGRTPASLTAAAAWPACLARTAPLRLGL